MDKGIVLHWPAENLASIKASLGAKKIREIRHHHVNVNGWKDIGYHYIVHRDESGEFRVYDGRHDSLPGAHCPGKNHWLGICVVYGMDETNPPAEMLEVLSKLMAALAKKYGLQLDTNHVIGHRDALATQCPGNYLEVKIPQLIQMAKEEKNPPAIKPGPKPPVNTSPEKQLGKIKCVIQYGEGLLAQKKEIELLRLNSQSFIHIGLLFEHLQGRKLVKYEYVPATEKSSDYILVVAE